MSLFDFIGKFIFFIIPGVISVSIINYLTGKKQSIDILNITYIFVLSGFSYILGNFIIFIVNFLPHVRLEYANITEIMSGNINAIGTLHLILSIFASFIMALLLTYAISKNLLFKLSNWLCVSNRTDNEDVWDKLFDEQPWIIFRDYTTNHTYYGRVAKASDNKEEREILLDEVTVYDDAGEELYKMKYIYFCRKSSEFSIEIDDYVKGGVNDATEKDIGVLAQTQCRF